VVIIRVMVQCPQSLLVSMILGKYLEVRDIHRLVLTSNFQAINNNKLL